MASTDSQQEENPTKTSKRPMLVGILMALVLGGASYYAVWSGVILAPSIKHEDVETALVDSPFPDVVFVPIQPLTINLGRDGNNNHLRFQAQLEVAKSAEKEVTTLLPRVTDVLNSYLRAVGASELENSSALVRLRAQMLRRVQVVTGQGRVRDLLIMEFVLN